MAADLPSSDVPRLLFTSYPPIVRNVNSPDYNVIKWIAVREEDDLLIIEVQLETGWKKFVGVDAETGWKCRKAGVKTGKKRCAVKTRLLPYDFHDDEDGLRRFLHNHIQCLVEIIS